MRKKLVETDTLECIIALAPGIFFSTGVSACILFLNKDKIKAHKGKLCLIDATNIYTAKRAQNILTEENVAEIFSLYQNYENVVEKSQIVANEDLKESLVPKLYIEQKKIVQKDPKEVKREFIETYQKMLASEEKMKKLLIEGGYINE